MLNCRFNNFMSTHVIREKSIKISNDASFFV